MQLIGYLSGAFIGLAGIYLYKAKKNAPKFKGTPEDVVNFFLNKGFSLNQSVGIAGNLKAESNFNALASGDNGSAFGIAQWRNDRLDNLKSFALDNKKDFQDFNTQLEFIYYELHNFEKTALAKLKASDTLESATLNFAQHYERPKSELIPKRIAYSKEIMNSLS